MRIGINGYLAARGGGGLARHIRVLLDGLLRFAPDHSYVVFSDQPLPERFLNHPRVESRVFPGGRYTLWEQVGLPLAMRGARLDVFFGPMFGLPLASRVPSLLGIHDLAYRLFPQTYSRKKRAYYEFFVGASVRRAQRVLTVSQSSARAISGGLGVPEKRIDVVYNALDPQFVPVTDRRVQAALRAKHGLPERFILSVGTIEARKNFERLLEAFALARREYGLDDSLVLVGGMGWQAQRVLALRDALSIERQVQFLGHVADADLPVLYSMATLFVLPSLYEGFGLPVLEAMACGTPVVTSNCSSLPEVAGGAALLVDPLDVRGLALALAHCCAVPALARRLRDSGRERAAAVEFTPRAMAKGTLGALEHAATQALSVGALGPKRPEEPGGFTVGTR